MDFLRSSIIGHEYINYRKSNGKDARNIFSNSVRKEGIGNVPIVVDTIDKQLIELFRENAHTRYKTKDSGKEYVLHMDQTLRDVIREIKILALQRNFEVIIKENELILGLEDLTIPDQDSCVGDLYKTHRNSDDKILYLMLMKKMSIYGYIASIARYLGLIT
jgi:hypothetical protein